MATNSENIKQMVYLVYAMSRQYLLQRQKQNLDKYDGSETAWKEVTFISNLLVMKLASESMPINQFLEKIDKMVFEFDVDDLLKNINKN